MMLSGPKEEKIIVLIKETNNFDEINNFFMNNYWSKNGIFVKLSLNEMEELKRFQGSTFDTISWRKWVEDRDTILEITGKIQELQNEINCMSDSRDFQDAESVRSGHSSKESWTWLSQIEDNGKKKYRREFTNEEFWSQKRKLWDKRRGQESGDKTAWTKKSGRLLAMDNQRAVFEMRQLQFPSRYQ